MCKTNYTKGVGTLFVLRNVINHELYTTDAGIDGEAMYGIASWGSKEELEKLKNEFIETNMGKEYVDDWEILELEDKFFFTMNHQLENDNDFKAYYYNSGAYEIFNTRTGKLTRNDVIE